MKGWGNSLFIFPELSAKLAPGALHQRIKLCTKQHLSSLLKAPYQEPRQQTSGEEGKAVSELPKRWLWPCRWNKPGIAHTHTRNDLSWTLRAEHSQSRIGWAPQSRAGEHKGHVEKGVGAHRVYVNGRKGWNDRMGWQGDYLQVSN